MALRDRSSIPVLQSLQQLFQAAIQNPNQLNSRRVMANVCDNTGLDSGRRLGIYQQGYRLRLLECLRAEFPILARAFSPEWFELMATHFLACHPSMSTNLNDLSAQFPAFLQSDRPDKNEKRKDKAYDFLINLAEFERAKIETSRGRGSEEAEHVQFLEIDAMALSLGRVSLAGNVRIIKVKFDLLAYLNKESDVCLEFIERDQFIVVCRHDYRVNYIEILEWQYDLLRELQVNQNADAVIEIISRAHPHHSIDVLVSIFLTQLAMRGAFLGVAADR